MFAHLVTAAKGLFTRQEPEEAHPGSAGASAATNPTMVTATRQRVVAPESAKDHTNAVTTNGKRKIQSTSTAKTDGQQTKRRKRSSLEAAETTEGDAAHDASPKTEHKSSAPPAKSNHFRFDSEEPVLPEETHPEEISQTPNHAEDEDEDDSDDAPEAIDNSAQLLKMKEQAKKQERAQQRYVLSPPKPTANSRWIVFWFFFSNLSTGKRNSRKRSGEKWMSVGSYKPNQA